MANQGMLKKCLHSPTTPCFTVATMTPAPPNNPGHQEAQGRRPSVHAPAHSTDVRFPNGHSSAESGFCHEPQCSGDTKCAATVLNALDALFRASGPDSRLKVGLTDDGDMQALLYLTGKPCSLVVGANVLEALQNLVR